MYSFGDPRSGTGCVTGDAFADHERSYTAGESVDGVADLWDDPVRGSFGQLRRLKQMHPGLKVLVSMGGWTWSGGFGTAAATASSRATFADNCYNFINDSRWAGVFNGIDIDWEYPSACGLQCDSSPYENHRLLMQALRSRFGSQLISAAVTADGTDGGRIEKVDYGGASQVMTYDFFGSFNAAGPTAPHSALNDYASMPQAGFSSASGINKYRSFHNIRFDQQTR